MQRTKKNITEKCVRTSNAVWHNVGEGVEKKNSSNNKLTVDLTRQRKMPPLESSHYIVCIE